MNKRKIDIESLKKGNIHRVPKGYFDELPLKIQSRIDARISIESIKKENVHQVPDKYFDELPLKIQTRINEQKETTPVFAGRMQLAWIMSAAVVVFIIGLFVFPKEIAPVSAEQMISEINTEDLIDYLYEENVSTDDILASIDTDYLLEGLSETEFDIIDSDMSDEELESIYFELDFSTEIM